MKRIEVTPNPVLQRKKYRIEIETLREIDCYRGDYRLRIVNDYDSKSFLIHIGAHQFNENGLKTLNIPEIVSV